MLVLQAPSAEPHLKVRRLSAEDKARVKALSAENDSAGWLKSTLFKKEAKWPRELFVGVQGCEGLVLYYAADSDTGNSKKNALPSNGHACVVNGHISTDDDNGGGEGLQGDGRRNRTAEDLEGDEVEREFQCFVRVHNNTTGNDLHTTSVKGSYNPVFGESFVVPCHGPRDEVLLGVYTGDEERGKLIGEAVLPLDARFVGGNREVLLELTQADGRTWGFVRVEAFWVDEAKPRKETGEFFYKVVHPSGISLRSQPSIDSAKVLHVMAHGEVFIARERQWHAVEGEEERTIFVKVSASADRWARQGWLFEALVDGNGRREPVLERVSPPIRERGNFFYRVCHPKGVRLHSRADVRSSRHPAVIGQGDLLEATEKWTPAGSPVTFVTVACNRGYIIGRCGEKVLKNEAGEPALEVVTCPEGVLISSQGTGEGVPPPPTLPRPPATPSVDDASNGHSEKSNNSAGTANNHQDHCLDAVPMGEPLDGDNLTSSSTSATAEAATETAHLRSKAAVKVQVQQQRLYRVRVGEGGVEATKTPDIGSTPVDKMKEGQPFYGKAEVVKLYEGIGEVAFVMRATDGLWVRANRPGMVMLLDLITDHTEAGAFTYRVCHENGVVVRTAPGLDAPPVKPRRILPVTKLINVCERLMRAEDIVEISRSRPPVFLRLAGNDGWVFDRRGRTLVCEDVTEKSRIATANAITAEAARVARSGCS